MHGSGHSILERVLRTSQEMLEDRGCRNVICSADLLNDIEEGKAVLTGEFGDGKSSIHLYIHAEDKVGIRFMRAKMDGARDRDEVLTIVVSIEGPTPCTRREFDDPATVQFMLIKDLVMNRTRHALVPRHERVDHPPSGVRIDDLPKILLTDPIVKYHNYPLGSIIRFERTWGGHEMVPYFRSVSSAIN